MSCVHARAIRNVADAQCDTSKLEMRSHESPQDVTGPFVSLRPTALDEKWRIAWTCCREHVPIDDRDHRLRLRDTVALGRLQAR